DITILANNGTIVRNIEDDEVKVCNYINDNDFYKLIESGRPLDLTPITHVNRYIDGYDMIGELDKTDIRYMNYIKRIEKRYRKVDNLLYVPEPKVLSVVFPGEKDYLLKLKEKIEDTNGEAYTMYLMDQLIGVSPILEIIKSNCSKWHSIEDYAKLKGIKNEEIISFGDDSNDLEMIENSGLGIAMKNAVDRVKSSSKMITRYSNNDSGVGFALKEIFTLD
ncbi:MAG: HAD hydrolase family protein, partial [Andreesenia angusta]|nr:HAD hydrolase family protein [Andreesenia angusta]